MHSFRARITALMIVAILVYGVLVGGLVLLSIRRVGASTSERTMDLICETNYEQMEEYLDYVRNDEHYCKYYDMLYIMFHTGLRISEFCGLTVSDIDFDNMRLNVARQLIRTHEGKYIIEKPKTQCGVRAIPMTDEVADCFARIIKNRKRIKNEPKIDGCIGFLYLSRTGMPRVAISWQKSMQRMREKFVNSRLRPFPKVTPHVCRHTFCSNMAKRGMNPKMLQYIMGHADVGVTLNTYTHIKIRGC